MYYFVTTNTDNRQQLFSDPDVAHFFLNTLRYFKPLLGFKIYSYVVMPDHIHLLIEPNDRYDLSRVMKAIKAIVHGKEKPDKAYDLYQTIKNKKK